MPILGEVKFNWDAPCREAEYNRWKENATRNFHANNNTKELSQSAFLWDWLGETGIRELSAHTWDESDKQKPNVIFQKLKAHCQPADNQTIYRNQFHMIRQSCSQTFSDLFHEICRIYDLCKFEEEGRCDDHKGCNDCQKAAKEIRIKDILMIAVRDDKLREEFKKLKGKESTIANYEKAGRSWDLENATKGAYNHNQTLTKEAIHAISHHKSKANNQNSSNNKFIKSCKFCGKSHQIKQCPAKDKTCNKCNKIGHFANKCRSSSQVPKLQRKAVIKPRQGTRPALSRSEPIHFMSAQGPIGVTDFGTIDDNFDNVQWIDSIEVSYNPPTHLASYGTKETTAAIHNIQKRQKSQAFTTVSMLPQDTEGKTIGAPIDVKCKIDTGAGANVMPVSIFRKLCPDMFDAKGKALEKFNGDWTTLTAYGGGIIKQFGVRMLKCYWNNKKWVILFHIVDAEGPILLGLKTLRQMGIFSKHPRVFIETIDIHSTNAGLARQQLKEGEEDGHNQSEYQSIASEVPKVGVAACPTPAEESQVPVQAINDNAQANVHLVSE